ncbi:uncharacterized protein LOC135494445 [Lineus longissimus]|uniref:uncharacterized protein LOC135494445 n=1 Tax=Lineus longissimus TaxID=88925 RepID=UPI00315DBDD2
MDDYSSSSSDDDSHTYDKAYRPPRASSASRGAAITIEEICKRKPYLVKRSDFLGVTLPSIVKLQYSICVAPESSSFADATKSSIMPPEKECEKMLEKLRASPSCSVFLPYGLFNLEGVGKFVYCHMMKKTKMMVQAEASWFDDLALLGRYESAENIPEMRMVAFRDFLSDHPFNKVMPLVGSVQATVEDLASMCCNRSYVDTVVMKFIDVLNRQHEDYFVGYLNAMLTDPGRHGKEARAKCFTKFIFILHVQQTASNDNVKPTVNIAGYDSDGGNHYTFCVMTLGESSADALYVDTLGLEAPFGMAQSLKQFLLGFLHGTAMYNVALNISYAHYPDNKKTHTCSYNCSVYPKQSCTVLGGPAVILGVALAIFFPTEFQTLTNTKRSDNECASLRCRITHLMPDLSSHARYLRFCVINWLSSGQVKIGNIIGEEKLKRFSKIKKPVDATDPVETFIVMTEAHVASPAVVTAPIGSSALRLRAATKKLRKWKPYQKNAAKGKEPSPDDNKKDDVAETVVADSNIETPPEKSPSTPSESEYGLSSFKQRLKDHIKQKQRMKERREQKKKPAVTTATEKNKSTDAGEEAQVSGGVTPVVPWQQIVEPVRSVTSPPVTPPAVAAPVMQPVSATTVTTPTQVSQSAVAAPVVLTTVTQPAAADRVTPIQVTQPAVAAPVAQTSVTRPAVASTVALTPITRLAAVNSVMPIQVPPSAVAAPVAGTPITGPAAANPVMQATQSAGTAPVVVQQNTQLAGMTGIAVTPTSHPAGVLPVTLTSFSRTVGVSLPSGVMPMTLTQIAQPQMMAMYDPGRGQGQTLVLTTLTSTEDPSVVVQKTAPVQTFVTYASPGPAGDGLSSAETAREKEPIVIGSDSEEQTPAPMEVQEAEMTEQPPDTPMTPSVTTRSSANKDTPVNTSAVVAPGVRTRRSAAKEGISLAKPGAVVQHKAEKVKTASLPVSPGLQTRSGRTLVPTEKQRSRTEHSVSHTKEPQAELSPNISDSAVTSSRGRAKPKAPSTPTTTVTSASAIISATQKDANTPTTSSSSRTMVPALLVKTPSGNKIIPLPGVDLESISNSGIAALPIVSADVTPSNIVTMTSTGVVAQTNTTTSASPATVSPAPSTSSGRKPNILSRSRRASSASRPADPVSSCPESTGEVEQNSEQSHRPGTMSVMQASTDFSSFEVPSGGSFSIYKLDENGQAVLLPIPAIPVAPVGLPQQDVGSDNVPAVLAAEQREEIIDEEQMTEPIQPTEIPNIDIPEDSEVLSGQQHVPLASSNTSRPSMENNAGHVSTVGTGPNIIKMSKSAAPATITAQDLATTSTDEVTIPQENKGLPAATTSTESLPTSVQFASQLSTSTSGKILSMSPRLMNLLKDNPHAKVTLPDGRELKVKWGKDSLTATAVFASAGPAGEPTGEPAPSDVDNGATKNTEDAGSGMNVLMETVASPATLPSAENASKRAYVKRQISLQASTNVMMFLAKEPQLFYESASKLLVVQAELKAYPGATITKEFPCESSDDLQQVISEAEQFFDGEAGLTWVREISDNYRVIMVPKQLRSHLRSNPILMFVAPDQLVISISIKKMKTIQKSFGCTELGFNDPNGMKEVINFVKGNEILTWLREEHGVELVIKPTKIRDLVPLKGKQIRIREMASFAKKEKKQPTQTTEVNLSHEPAPEEVKRTISDVSPDDVTPKKIEKVKKPKKKYPKPVTNYPMDAPYVVLEFLGKEPSCKFDDKNNNLQLHIQLNVDKEAKFTRQFPCEGEDSVETVQAFLNSEECLAWVQGLHALFRTMTVPKNLRSFLSANPLLKYCEPDQLMLMMKPRKGGPVTKDFDCTELGFEDAEAMRRVNDFVSGLEVYDWLQKEHGVETALDFEGVTCFKDLLVKPYTLRYAEPASIRLRACFKNGKVVFKGFSCTAKGLEDEEAMARIEAFANGPEGMAWARKNASVQDAEGRNEWVESGTLAVGLETRWFFDNFKFDTKNCLNYNKKCVDCIVPNAVSVSIKKHDTWGITHRTDETYTLTEEVEPGSIQVTRYVSCSGVTSACRTECGALLNEVNQGQDEQYCQACSLMLYTDEEMLACTHCGLKSGSRKSWGKVDGHLMCVACYRYYKKTHRLRSKEIIEKFSASKMKINHKHLQCGWKMKLVLYSDDMSTWKLFKCRGNDFYHQEEAYQPTKRPSQSQRDMWDQQILTAGHSSKTTMITKKIMSMGDGTVSLKRIRGRLKRIKEAKGVKLKLSSGRKAIRKVPKRQTTNLTPKEEIIEVEESEQEDDAAHQEDTEAAENVEYDGVETIPETIHPELETISAEALAQFAQTVDEQKIVILQDHMLCSMCIAQKMNPPFTCSSSDELFKHTSKAHFIKLFSCTTCWSQGALVSFDSEHDLTSHVTARHALSGHDLKRQLAAASSSGAKSHTMSEEVLSAIDSIINADEFVTVQEQQQELKRKARTEFDDAKRVCTDGDILRCAECQEECNARAMCCDNCHSWYHWQCISFTQDQTNGKWFCLKCLPV